MEKDPLTDALEQVQDLRYLFERLKELPKPQGEEAEKLPYNAHMLHMAQLREDLSRLQQPVIEAFQKYLATLEGQNFENLEENRRIAGVVQEIADRLNVLFRCTRCGEPSRFRCSESANAKTGVFVFSHGRQTHGGTTKIPPLTLAENPAESEEDS